MRKTRYLGLLLLWMPSLVAQHAAGERGGLPPVRPIPPLGMPGPGFRAVPHSGFHRAAPFAYPLFFGDYEPGYQYYTPSEPAPSVVIVQTPPQPYVLVPQAVNQAPRVEIHEYYPAPNVPAPGEEPPTFVIVLKDGSVRSAIAVAVQDNSLHYVEPDGRHQRVALDAVDRDATVRRNREHKLELQLPPSDH